MHTRVEPSAGVDERELLAGYPAPRESDPKLLAAAAATARRIVVLDDDPTGTQSVVDVPVVTAWESDDIRWALRQGTPGFYVLTNTRSLGEAAAAARNREAVDAAISAARTEQLELTMVSRSDSTLRGHFPLETDVIIDALRGSGIEVDGVVLIPAFTDAGRITVDSTHWVRTAGGMVRANETEFARDPEFGYSAATLPDYVAEKSRGRWPSDQVARITLEQLRRDSPTSIAADLAKLRRGQPAVADAAGDEDLRVLALAAIEAERLGVNLVYRTGPSFVRSRLGQDRNPAISDATLESVLETRSRLRVGDAGRDSSPHGLVVAGSYVGLTTHQLERLCTLQGLQRFTLDIEELLACGATSDRIESLVDRMAAALGEGDVVLATSRKLVTADDEVASRAIQAQVSATLVEVVRRLVVIRRPRWIVAKGGITSSDLATGSLGIRRAWVRGTLLPGIVSLWEPVNESAQPIPYVIFAGNVGDAESLGAVVKRLRGEN